MFIYLTFLNFLRNGFKEIVFSLKFLALLTAGFSFINAYWLLPQIDLILNNYNAIFSRIGGVEGAMAWSHEIGKYTSIVNLLRLQGVPDWYDNPSHPYSNLFINNPILIILSFLPIAIICVGFFLSRKTQDYRKLLSLFYILLVVGLIFTAGSHPPFGFINLFLIKTLPAFAIFRSAFYKFGPVLWFSTIFLTAYYAHFLLGRFIKRRLFYNISCALLVLIILLYHFPFFTINFFIWNKPFATKVKIPDYVYKMSDYVDKQTPLTSRILLLPPLDNYYGTDGYTWGYWGLDPLPELVVKNRSVIGRAEDSFDIHGYLYNTLITKNGPSFLQIANTYGINKILWRNDILYTDKITSSKDFLNLQKNLENLNYISLEKRIEKWSLYNISSNNISPLVYISKPLNTSVVPSVSFKKLNPTKYSVRISNAKEKYILVLNQAFNKGWKVHIEEQIPEENHILINDFLNGWLIEKRGSYNFYIEYEPQKLAHTGIFISLVTILVLIFTYHRISKK